MPSQTIPSGWVQAKISDIAIKGMQRKPKSGESFTYVDIGSIDRSLKRISVPQVIDGGEAPSRARKIIENGDVLVSLTRPNLNAVALVSQKYHKQIASTGFEVIKPVFVDSRYIFALVRSKEFIDQISGVVQGALYPAAKSSDVQNFAFALPPLAEQKVIADKLDTLLVQVENTKARLERIPQILKRFRQSVLAAAVSGRLAEAWLREKSAQKESWPILTAKEICEKVQSGSTPKNNPFEQNGTVPFLKVYNIVDQKIDFEYRSQFITEEVHTTKLKRSIGYPGDILMNIVGPPLGKVAILPDTHSEWNLNQALTLFRPEPGKLLPKFLYYVLCEGSLVRDVTHDLKGIVGQVNISLTQCREAKIPCPSLTEQTEIVRRVDQLFAHADRIEQQVNQALARISNLTQSILAKAFCGELTEQWRKDNPGLISGENSAEALLERIKAERITVVKQTRGRS
ncbi:restriction endonuclease subunit S [Vreelandella glaciei]|uniref:restriction endonuclease subunit S n=1 Tax=Vreelandella glaciei TaxID=186761 RepID=UPI0030012860